MSGVFLDCSPPYTLGQGLPLAPRTWVLARQAGHLALGIGSLGLPWAAIMGCLSGLPGFPVVSRKLSSGSRSARVLPAEPRLFSSPYSSGLHSHIYIHLSFYPIPLPVYVISQIWQCCRSPLVSSGLPCT